MYSLLYFCKLLYMFRVVNPPIIRSTYNCNYSNWRHWSNRLCYLPLSWSRWLHDRLADMASRESKHNPVRIPTCVNKQRSCFVPLPALHNQTSHNIHVYVCVFLQHLINVKHILMKHCIRPSTVWTVRGSNPGGGETFRNCPDRPWAHTASCTMSTGSFSGVKSGRGVTLTPHPLLVPWS